QQTVTGSFVMMQGTNQVGFQLGRYDHSQPLVIDPVVVYSTYLGGTGDDFGTGIAVDSSGNTYVTGRTDSLDFPTTSDSYQATVNFGVDWTYVTKYDPTGKKLSSTYLGSNSIYNPSGSPAYQFVANGANAIAVDKAGNVYLTGYAEFGYSYVPFPTTLTPFPASSTPGFSAEGT